MAFLTAPIAGLLGSVIGAGASILSRPKRPKPVLQQTVDKGAEEVFARDRLSRRRGAAANAILGAKGAESSTGKTSLGT